MMYAIDATLAALITPIPVDVFFRDYYGKKILHVPGAPDKFQAWYDEETWRTVPLRETTVVYPSDLNGVPVTRVIPIPPAQVMEFYEAGLQIVGRVDSQPRIAALMDGLRASLQFPSGKVTNLDKVLCFASKVDAGYKLHWDLHHNFILQIAGAKRWHCGEAPAVDAPLDGALVAAPGEPAAEYDGEIIVTPRLEDLKEFVLHPGDFLYLPPGTWHAPLSLGPSNHLSVALGHRPIYKLISDVLKVEIGRKRWWRQGFPTLRGEDRHTGAVPQVIAEIFEEAISRLREELVKVYLFQFNK
jgi:ribosomal protein L16 Arg81 hydroxylase